MEPIRVCGTFQDTTIDVTDDINEVTESLVDLICKITEATAPICEKFKTFKTSPTSYKLHTYERLSEIGEDNSEPTPRIETSSSSVGVSQQGAAVSHLSDSENC